MLYCYFLVDNSATFCTESYVTSTVGVTRSEALPQMKSLLEIRDSGFRYYAQRFFLGRFHFSIIPKIC